jgi:heterodisulfide reductase subunit D
MNFMESLSERAADIAARCTKCGRCVEVCPMPPLTGIDTANPAAVAAGVIEILRTGSGAGPAERWVTACSGSGNCIDACNDGINPRFMIHLARLARNRDKDDETVRNAGKDSFKKMARAVRVLSRLQLQPDDLSRLSRSTRAAGDPAPDVVFYTGCNVLRTPHIALLCLDVMDRLDIDYTVYGGPSDCCGILQMRAGDAGNAGRQGDRTVDRFFGTGAAAVLSWCPTCQIQLGESVLPPREAEDPFGMTMFVNYLVGRLDDLRPLMINTVRKRVGLHEHSGAIGVTEAVITLLKAIPGLEYVDLEQPRVGYMCTALSGAPALRADWHAEQLQAAENAGVDTLAGVYHACHRDLCAHEKEWPFEVVNFMELLGESMGIRRPDLFKRLKMMQDVDAIIADSTAQIDEYGLDHDEVRDVVLQNILGEQSLPLNRAADGAAGEQV